MMQWDKKFLYLSVLCLMDCLAVIFYKFLRGRGVLLFLDSAWVFVGSMLGLSWVYLGSMLGLSWVPLG